MSTIQDLKTQIADLPTRIEISFSASVSNCLLSINEARELLDFQPIVTREPMTIERLVSKIKCEYCSRPNAIERELCASCGAPLPC